MTQDEIIETAKQAGIKRRTDVFFSEYCDGICFDDLETFAKLVAEKERERMTVVAMDAAEKAVDVAMKLEREACAKLCAEDGVQAMDFTGGTFVGGYFAKRIMERGDI
jgi:hypothetical protein